MSELGTQSGRDNLLSGDFPIVTESVTIISGQDLKRGAILGKITASGKYILSASAAGDGSEVPSLVLSKDTDASAGDTIAPTYASGEFNQNQVILGVGHTIASIKAGLKALSIFLQDTIQG